MGNGLLLLYPLLFQQLFLVAPIRLIGPSHDPEAAEGWIEVLFVCQVSSLKGAFTETPPRRNGNRWCKQENHGFMKKPNQRGISPMISPMISPRNGDFARWWYYWKCQRPNTINGRWEYMGISWNITCKSRGCSCGNLRMNDVFIPSSQPGWGFSDECDDAWLSWILYMSHTGWHPCRIMLTVSKGIT